ncbi:hypothetical protein OF83DRAFT_1161950 [Amylostereum chailletii]|nr:hypothetical protein OF83DRAFT_1161950 [Amylostereum chailletii]
MANPAEPPPPTLPTSAFSFSAPFPTALKQRRVSLALPSAPRQVAPWTFRDDTALGSDERKGKVRKLDRTPPDDLPEKKARKKWTMEETQMLVDGCNRHGVGNWKAILNDPTLSFDNRSPVDLKDRFRTYFPDAYKQHYPNAKTHLSSKVRSSLPDGSSIFEKTRSKRRRPFTAEEDRALKAGYDKHGTVWATIVKDPIFQEQNRRSTDLRDRFRNAFPELYQAAGYKPRSASKRRIGAFAQSPVRAATDEQLTSARETGPARRKRRHTTQGFLRGGTKSVPLSPTGSEDEDSSADEEEEASASVSVSASCSKSSSLFPDTPSDVGPPSIMADAFGEVEMQVVDDPLAIPDFIPSSSQSMSDMNDASQSQAWSGIDTPMHSTATWSTSNAAGSPTSSHDMLFDSPYNRRGVGGMNMIGKSAWGPSDWLAGNPRLDPSGASDASFFNGFSASPSSPFAFAHLSHGVLDRYDLFPASSAHDFASEVGAGDTHSTFSDPEMLTFSAFRGFTHHSNTAGDLIFGARTHQPQQAPDYGPGFGFGGAGLGLSSTPPSMHALQLHNPALPGIDEIELSAINLNDGDPIAAAAAAAAADTVMDTLDPQPKHTRGRQQDDFLLSNDEIAGLSRQQVELADTPPGTPVRSRQSLPHASGPHNRSLSVPPPEHRFLPSMDAHPPVHAPFTPTRSLSLDVAHHGAGTGTSADLQALLLGVDTAPWRTTGGLDMVDLPFLDLHYFGGVGGMGMGMGESGSHSQAHLEGARQGLALDLAGATQLAHARAVNFGVSPAALQHVPPVKPTLSSPPVPPVVGTGQGAGKVGAGRERLHHRGQSAVSPQDLLMRKGGDNKRKRASWDGGPR